MAIAKIWMVVLVGVLVVSGSAWGIDGLEAIRRQQERFQDLKDLSAQFKKRHYWKLVDQATEIKGRLYVQKPDRFRFETDVQTVMTDGQTAWNYVPDNEQVLMSSYGQIQEDRSYEKLLFDLILLGGYAERFIPTYAGEERVDGKRCHLVELASRGEERYISRVRLWVDRGMWLVRRVEYVNINDDVTTYELSNLKVDPGLKVSFFKFELPQEIEVIDLR
ncbi:MAG: outer membrane lipoprotein carrier protein LolA [bacterium]|nr:outer membrane lipoprotein carrier protein LolA [bacterium]